MNILVLDLETTVQPLGGKIDNSPFNPENKCVSAHFGWLTDAGVTSVTNLVFNHNDQPVADSTDDLRDALANADVLVAHNLKFDAQWLQEMGFTLPETLRCTLINEYILAKGQRIPLSLKETAQRRNVTLKKSDLVDDLFKSGTGFEAMPLPTVIEYAEADVKSCGDIYLSQLEDFGKPENTSLDNIVILMNEMTDVLLDMQCNGINIDMGVLDGVEDELRKEYSDIKRRLTDIVEMVMGDTPINLNSGADMTKVVYSRTVIDRDAHIRTFNIGLRPDGRPKYPPRMNKAEFSGAVRTLTRIVHKTDAVCCPDCNGRGTVQKYKKVTRQKNGKKYVVQGEAWKNPSKCKTCKGLGAIYASNGKQAGLKLSPVDVSYASVNGFKTDKHTIVQLIRQAEGKGNDLAVEFLTKLTRLNALSTYLDSFITGIRTWTRHDGILHSSFNQCIAATGRLSSSSPNFQNLPKRGFPVRKAMTSRFDGGTIVEADFSGLEFVVAGELSRDPQIISDIKNGKDIHSQTASIINQIDPSEVTKDLRQAAKSFTFSPVYGGQGGGEPEHIQKYFREFFEIYRGLGAYHKRLMDGVLQNGVVKTPSGRQYYWPDVKRLKNGRTTHATQIVNYPVQGFATGDLVPLSCIRAKRAFKREAIKSLIILTVHDSLVVDCYPGEEDKVRGLLKDAMVGVTDEAKDRWGYEPILPLNIDIESGDNWAL